MATTLFLDTFTGAAGSLSSHTPDVAPAPSAWTEPFGGPSFQLDGSGYVIPSAPVFLSSSFNRFTPTIPFDTSSGFVLTAEMRNGDGSLGRPIAISSAAALVSITDAGTGLKIFATCYDESNNNHNFAEISASTSAYYTVKISVLGTAARLYIDNVLQEELVLPGGPWGTIDQIQLQGFASGTDSNFQVGLVHLTTAESTPPFWTNFVKTFEVP